MKIIAIVNPKGGVGKTNTTRTVARGLALEAKRVWMGETDPQNSLIEWKLSAGNTQKQPSLIELNASSVNNLNQSIAKSLTGYANEPENEKRLDYFVIDGCALEFRFINSVLNVADLVIVPTQASSDDLCQLGEIIELIESVQIKRQAKKLRPLLARSLINKAKIGTRSLTESLELLNNKDNVPFPSFKTVIRDYEGIRRAAQTGGTAFESDNKNARADAKNLVKEIMRLTK